MEIHVEFVLNKIVVDLSVLEVKVQNHFDEFGDMEQCLKDTVQVTDIFNVFKPDWVSVFYSL